MKYIFVLGHTKSGKTTLANNLKATYPQAAVYEAGAWARALYKAHTGVEVTSANDTDPALRAQMTQLAMATLKADPDHSFKVFVAWTQANAQAVNIITGIRNPHDFFSMLHALKGHEVECHVLAGHAKDEFEKGVDIIGRYLNNEGIDSSYAAFESRMHSVPVPLTMYHPGYQKEL